MATTRSYDAFPHVIQCLVLLVFCTPPTAQAGEGFVLSLGVYQVYKTPKELWLIANVDCVDSRPSYEPRELRELKIIHINETGTVQRCSLPRKKFIKPSVNSGTRHAYLARVLGETYWIADGDGIAWQTTKSGKPLKQAKKIDFRRLYKKLNSPIKAIPGNMVDEVEAEMIRIRRLNSLYLTKSNYAGFFGTILKELPKNLVAIELEFKDEDIYGCPKVVIAKSLSKEKRWSKTLIDIAKLKLSCP